MMRLLLIRHGRSTANEQLLYCGFTDVSLSEAGREALREKRRQGGYPDIGGRRVVTSGLRRCEETLSLLFGEREHEILPALREMNFGAFEGKSYAQMEQDPAFRRWIEKGGEEAPPGGESSGEMTERVLAALRQLMAGERDTLAVFHGGPIAAAMGAFFPEEGRNRFAWQPQGGEGYELLCEGGRPLSWRPVPEK